jgi:hypothetical protein
MRLTVASQKILQAQHIVSLRLADQYRPGGTRLDMGHPAQDQRADDALAKVGFGNDQRTKPIGWKQQRFHVVFRIRIDQSGSTRELGDLTGEISAAVTYDRHDVTQTVTLAYRQRTFQHQEHTGRRIAGREHALAATVLPTLTEPADARNLRLGQPREGLILTPRNAARERGAGLKAIDPHASA